MCFIMRIRKSALTFNSVWCRDNMRGLGPCVEGLIPSIETNIALVYRLEQLVFIQLGAVRFRYAIPKFVFCWLDC